MNQRKQAFQKGLSTLRRAGGRGKVSPGRGTICALGPKRYNQSGMPYDNQIIQGNSIELLNAERPEWVDLVFADPPFNIGYLYHGYEDEKKAEDYLDFSKDWMTAVHRALKPTGSFYLAIGDDYAAELGVIA
jgi:DNA modification methylase